MLTPDGGTLIVAESYAGRLTAYDVAVRLAEGGRVLDRIDLDRGCFACALGGPEGRTLHLVTTQWSPAALLGGPRTGQVRTLPAPAPAAG